MVVFKSRSYAVSPTPGFDFSATMHRGRKTLCIQEGIVRSARRSVYRLFLASSWLAGLIAGFLFYSQAGDILDPWMRGPVFAPVSIRSLLGVCLLPYLFTAFVVLISRPRLICLIAFFKAFLWGLVGLAVQRCWGNAGWLARWLLCFSSVTSGPVLYWFWLRHIDGSRGSTFSETALLLSLAAILGSTDYFIIAPFVARLIYS